MSWVSLKCQCHFKIELSHSTKQNSLILLQMELKGAEIRKQEMCFAPHWTHGNLLVHNSDVTEWH